MLLPVSDDICYRPAMHLPRSILVYDMFKCFCIIAQSCTDFFLCRRTVLGEIVKQIQALEWEIFRIQICLGCYLRLFLEIYLICSKTLDTPDRTLTDFEAFRFHLKFHYNFKILMFSISHSPRKTTWVKPFDFRLLLAYFFEYFPSDNIRQLVHSTSGKVLV